jgi:transposase-like protein
MARATNVKKNKKTKTRTRRKYSPEFKDNAVKLAMAADTTIAEVARDLGIHEKNLYDWTAKAKQQARGGLSFEEHEELVQLRREVKRLRMERDILKKATALMARDNL